jgi:hypothetical protein
MTINQLAQEINDMANRRNPSAEYYRINDTTKLSLVQRTNGRWIIYRLTEGEKSKQIRGFAEGKYDIARQYCLDKQKAADTIKVRTKRTKVTLVGLDRVEYPDEPQTVIGRLDALAKRVERLERELGIGES